MLNTYTIDARIAYKIVQRDYQFADDDFLANLTKN